MDKQALSHYGWITIMTLILSVMLAFVTPFGKYVGRGLSNIIMAGGDTMEHMYQEGYEDNMEFYDQMFNGDVNKFKEAGLYAANSDFGTLSIDWARLTQNNVVRETVCDDGQVKLETNYDKDTKNNASSAAMNGELSIKAGIWIIGEYGFAGCHSLTSVNLKDVQLIESYAFLNCSKLESIILDSPQLKLIDTNAFSNCPKLSKIYFNGTYAEFQEISIREQGISGQIISVICTDKTVKIKF